MKIKRWIAAGNDDFYRQGINTTEQLLEAVGPILDDHCTSDIVGEVLFEADNGKTYVGTVEFVISEANPEYVKAVLEGE